ncbi:MAG: aminomethyl-transferring glycine dehydrogenase subunit GcvPB, partial [Chloroflexia bacterium]|nr:aminomethyl-transferring glycine dehydrogenase subunit GcvPB [Chloroflexia bacterium]
MDTYEPHIYELSALGKHGTNLPRLDVPEAALPTALLRQDGMNDFPELTEPEVMRHYTRISQRNASPDTM